MNITFLHDAVSPKNAMTTRALPRKQKRTTAPEGGCQKLVKCLNAGGLDRTCVEAEQAVENIALKEKQNLSGWKPGLHLAILAARVELVPFPVVPDEDFVRTMKAVSGTFGWVSRLNACG